MTNTTNNAKTYFLAGRWLGKTKPHSLNRCSTNAIGRTMRRSDGRRRWQAGDRRAGARHRRRLCAAALHLHRLCRHRYCCVAFLSLLFVRFNPIAFRRSSWRRHEREFATVCCHSLIRVILFGIVQVFIELYGTKGKSGEVKI